VIGVQGDMTEPADIDRAVAQTIERFGQIDVLVTCAGSSPGGLLENLTEEEWFGSLNLKFMGYVRSCRAILPHMVERGSGAIVLVVGNDGLKPSYWEMTAGAANAADLNFASSRRRSRATRASTSRPRTTSPSRRSRSGGSARRRRSPTSSRSWPRRARASSTARTSPSMAASARR
jgi:NADP-dependent 3-hydroxy acid dehydrogenase YdfG